MLRDCVDYTLLQPMHKLLRQPQRGEKPAAVGESGRENGGGLGGIEPEAFHGEGD